MATLELKRPRGFALEAAANFYGDFVPGSGMASASASGELLTLTFRLDHTFEAVAVELRQRRDRLQADVQGTRQLAKVERQLTRMLGLDVDAEAWLGLGEQDPVVGKLQAEFPGFFTAAKPSPYDAAAWGIIQPRTNLRAAAKLKLAMGEQHGDTLTTRTGVHHVFPSPQQLLAIQNFPGLTSVKLERLHGIAHAALEGRLDAERLRALPEQQALAELQALPGVGPWTASHILHRGAASPDGLATAEPRVLHGLADAYGIASAGPEILERLAENWRPFRMWVCVLLARHLAKVGGWSAPGLARERAAAGKRLATERRVTRSSWAR